MDRFVAAGSALIGEEPRDDLLVRYRWRTDPVRDASGFVWRGYTSTSSDGSILVRSVSLIHEHELAHVVHAQAWGWSQPFLNEGFAVLLDPRRGYEAMTWKGISNDPRFTSLDDVLSSSDLPGDLFPAAWYIVSQIVRDHGFDGLHALWEAVPRGATASEVRAAYEQTFGEPMDVIFENLDPIGVCPDDPCNQPTRVTCTATPCTAEPSPWTDDAWSATAPTGCEDDPTAIGPFAGIADHGDVWRDATVDIDQWEKIAPETSAVTSVNMMRCGLRCWAYNGGPYLPLLPDIDEPETFWNGGEFTLPIKGRYRVEVRRDLEDLPDDTPGTFTLRVQPPMR